MKVEGFHFQSHSAAAVFVYGDGPEMQEIEVVCLCVGVVECRHETEKQQKKKPKMLR